MKQNILLVEPSYKCNFPPLGLMKLSSYHKALGDNVTFRKGLSKDIVYDYWDRVYITTLFTYYWKATIDTINYYKYEVLGGDGSRIYVGGIMASLMKEELWRATGVQIIPGILDKPAMLGDNNKRIIDNETPDYSILNEGDYKEDLVDSYLGYATRGCPRTCKFCGVPTIEPNFIDYKGIQSLVNGTIQKFGEKRHLVLLDNNVLNSKQFEKIIHDIIDLGFEKGGKLNKRLRRVDFNQGIDARLLNDSNMKLLSKIAINPLRIAFDNIRLRKHYEKSIRQAAKHGILNLSNYILYNYRDTPEELWQRLKINIDLNRELGTRIYSFPMKFIPLYAKDRSHIDPNWNWQFIRGVQRILNVLKGSVMTGEDFFYRAFGESPEAFLRILHMPERILMSRSRGIGPEEVAWVTKFDRLSTKQKNELLEILCTCRSEKALLERIPGKKDGLLKQVLEFYVSPSKPLPRFDDTDTTQEPLAMRGA